jgi:hypothetical protein
MTRYVLRYSRKYTFGGYVPVQEDQRTHYLHKNVTRSSQGWLNTRITEDIDQARTWATLEGIDGFLAKNLTSNSGSSWDVIQVES